MRRLRGGRRHLAILACVLALFSVGETVATGLWIRSAIRFRRHPNWAGVDTFCKGNWLHNVVARAFILKPGQPSYNEVVRSGFFASRSLVSDTPWNRWLLDRHIASMDPAVRPDMLARYPITPSSRTLELARTIANSGHWCEAIRCASKSPTAAGNQLLLSLADAALGNDAGECLSSLPQATLELYHGLALERDDDAAATRIFHSALDNDEAAGEALAKRVLAGPDSTHRKDVIVILARHGSKLVRDRVDDAFAGATPRTELFSDSRQYAFTATAAEYEDIAGHPYLGLDKQWPPIMPVSGSDDPEKWRLFIAQHPWFPGTDDAYYRLAFRLFSNGDHMSAWQVVTEYLGKPLPDRDAHEFLMALSRRLLRSANCPGCGQLFQDLEVVYRKPLLLNTGAPADGFSLLCQALQRLSRNPVGYNILAHQGYLFEDMWRLSVALQPLDSKSRLRMLSNSPHMCLGLGFSPGSLLPLEPGDPTAQALAFARSNRIDVSECGAAGDYDS